MFSQQNKQSPQKWLSLKRFKQFISRWVVLLLLLQISLPLWLISPIPHAHALNSTFTQTSWSGGISPVTATHTSNQTGWTQYTSKSSDLNALSELSPQAETLTFTSDTDFSSTNTVEVIYDAPWAYSWTVPAGITSVNAVCVGGGGGSATGVSNLGKSGASGGGGGALAYTQNMSVTPGESLSVTVGAGGTSAVNDSTGTASDGGGSSVYRGGTSLIIAGGGKKGTFNSTSSNPGGAGGTPSGTQMSGGGSGGTGGAINADSVGGAGGGGAGGYSGNGGNGGTYNSSGSAGNGGSGGWGGGGASKSIGGGAGGGVGIYGEGTSGSVSSIASGAGVGGGKGGSGGEDGDGAGDGSGAGGLYGGGGGGGPDDASSTTAGSATGGGGACRIWIAADSAILDDVVIQWTWSAGKILLVEEVWANQVAYTSPGTHSWTVPSGVSSVSAVCVGGGGGGSASTSSSNWISGWGGWGGGLHWRNNVSVTSGEQLTVIVGNAGTGGTGAGSNNATSWWKSSILRSSTTLLQAFGGSKWTYNNTATGGAGGVSGYASYWGGGGSGGAGGWGASGNSAGWGWGAGGYSGNWGNGSTWTSYNETAGTGGGGWGWTGMNSFTSKVIIWGGVGVYGEGDSGAANLSSHSQQGNPGSGGSTKYYGGGGSGAEDDSSAGGADGGHGACRIIWGDNRAFPSTNTQDMTWGGGGYLTSGTYTSGITDFTQAMNFSTLTYNITEPSGTGLSIDVRAGNTTIPDGTWTSWQTNITSGGSLTTLNGKRYLQYRANLTTTNTSNSPTLEDLSINYYPVTDQELISSVYNTEFNATRIEQIKWTEGNPSQNDIKVQLRTSGDGNTWWPWCGPDNGINGSCNSGTYFTNPLGETIDDTQKDANADQYFQYKIILQETTVQDIEVLYNATSHASLATSPVTQVISSSATGNGEVVDTWGIDVARFIEWGTVSGNYPHSCSAGTGGNGSYSCSITNLSPDTTYYYRAKASNVNSTVYGEEVSFTTPTLPSISINNPSSAPAQSKTLTASADKGSLTQSITTNTTCNDTLSFSAYSSTTFNSENDNGKYICYRAVDASSGTSYTLSNQITNLDTGNPNASLSVSNGVMGDNDWWTTTPDISLNTGDVESSVAEYRWAWDDATPDTWAGGSTASTTIPSNGEHTLYYESKDAAGNVSGIQSQTFKLDTVNPTFSTSWEDAGTLGNNGWYTSAPTLRVTITDNLPGSGVAGQWREYGDSSPDVWSTANITDAIPSEGTTTDYYQGKDNAGRTTVIGSTTTNLDTVNPTASLSYTNDWVTNTSVTVTTSESDATSGVDTCILKQSTTDLSAGSLGAWSSYLSVSSSCENYSFTASNGKAYKFQYVVTDISWRSVTHTSSNILKVDTTAPTLESKTSFTSDWHTNNQVSTFTYVDEESGVVSGNSPTCNITTESTTASCTTTLNNVCNAAGLCNTENQTSNSIKLDKTAPVLASKTNYTTAWYNSDQISTFTYSDTLSGVVSGNNPNCTISTESNVSTCTNTTINVCDAAWNCNTENQTSNSIKLDKQAPITSTPTDEGAVSIDQSLPFVWTGSDSLSGIVSYEICITDDKIESCVVSETTDTTNYTWDSAEWGTTYYAKVRATDAAGNTSQWSPWSDGVAPDGSAPVLASKTIFSSNWYTTDQLSTFTYVDAESGIASGNNPTCTISNEGASATCTNQNINVCDNAGNCNATEQTSNPIKLDKSAPTGGQVWHNNTNQRDTNIIVNVNPGTDSLSGLSGDNADYLLEVATTTHDGSNCWVFSSFTDANVSETASTTQYTYSNTSVNNCYQFRYTVTDNVGFTSTYTSSDVTVISENGLSEPAILHSHNDGVSSTDTSPTLEFSLPADSDGDPIKYQIQIDNNADFSSPAIDYTEDEFGVGPRNNLTYAVFGLDNGNWFWRVRILDDHGGANNWSVASTGFTVDTQLPVSKILYPQNQASLKNVDYIFGRSTDADGVDFTRISIRNLNTGKYFDGTSFSADTETWITTTSAFADKPRVRWWMEAPDWEDFTSYTIRSRATDMAGNEEHTDAITFTYDTVNGSEGSIYVSNPGVDNNSDYTIFYPNTVPVPNGGYIEIDFEDSFAFSPWLEDSDVKLSDNSGNITNSTDTFNRKTKTITSKITGGNVIGGDIIELSINNLMLHNPSATGSYVLPIKLYSSGGSLLEAGTGSITLVDNYEQVEINVSVAESLQLRVDSGSVLLEVDPDVQLGQNWVGTGWGVLEKTEIEVKTNAQNGYNLMISLAGNTATGSAVLDGQTLSGSQISSTAGSRLSIENNFTFGLNTGTAASVTAFTNTASQVSGAGSSNATNSYIDNIFYYLNIDYVTPADTYQGTITYTAVGQF